MTLLVLTFATAMHSSVLSAEHLKAPIVPGAIALKSPGRYESTRSYEETLDYYKRAFRSSGGVRWRSIINLPSIKARHLQSTRRKSKWDGINIYEHNGRVIVYVLPRQRKR